VKKKKEAEHGKRIYAPGELGKGCALFFPAQGKRGKDDLLPSAGKKKEGVTRIGRRAQWLKQARAGEQSLSGL